MVRDSSAPSTARFAGCLPVVPLPLDGRFERTHSTPLHGVHSTTEGHLGVHLLLGRFQSKNRRPCSQGGTLLVAASTRLAHSPPPPAAYRLTPTCAACAPPLLQRGLMGGGHTTRDGTSLTDAFDRRVRSGRRWWRRGSFPRLSSATCTSPTGLPTRRLSACPP